LALRAGPVGLGCEAGLGPCRGWRSGRPDAPVSALSSRAAYGVRGSGGAG